MFLKVLKLLRSKDVNFSELRFIARALSSMDLKEVVQRLEKFAPTNLGRY